MDPITALIASSKIKVGLWGKDFFTFLTTNFEWFFDAIANGLTYVLQGLINIRHSPSGLPLDFKIA